MLGPRTSVPTPFPNHTQGIFFSVDWTQIEPTKGNYNWTPITDVLASLPAGKVAEVVIDVGAYSSPMTQGNCTVNGLSAPACTGWLGSEIDSVPILAAVGPNCTGQNCTAHGFAPCTTLQDPNPLNTNYQSDWIDMVQHAAAEFATDTRIAWISVAPFSDVGGNISLSTKSTATGTVGSCTTTTSTYNAEWASLMTGYGITTDDQWGAALTTAFQTLWNGYVTAFAGKTTPLWASPFSIPDLTGAPGSNLSKTKAYNKFFSYATTHRPAGGYFAIYNEALQNSTSWTNAVNITCDAGTPCPADLYGAQMARAYCAQTDNNCETDGSCVATGSAGLENAAIVWGTQNSGTPNANTEQIYFYDVQRCTAEMPAISAALGGP